MNANDASQKRAARPNLRRLSVSIGVPQLTVELRILHARDSLALMASEQSLFPRAMSLAVHELRTPVTVVAGYLRMLLKEQGGPLTDIQRKMLEEADRSCGRINALVTEMSELGKLEGGMVEVARA